MALKPTKDKPLFITELKGRAAAGVALGKIKSLRNLAARVYNPRAGYLFPLVTSKVEKRVARLSWISLGRLKSAARRDEGDRSSTSVLFSDDRTAFDYLFLNLGRRQWCLLDLGFNSTHRINELGTGTILFFIV